ncbi:conserved hypothetical protein [Leishmania mexicana MHOM/GT/2001/U1103]|uniref:Uncharacterized protein n=1 Tax=Leishmania mexicana (strain MHOM/GT/2001/U1103) TaxID=929439 RepID=E9AMZ0_LEIMU|nr:conserved hypothetical protein [Leishmania mexicana MHOM/GT/2001/U1103]CBZ24295.1 conserved hypothetical protein [Leishmania mexicana MHOM/GT/2001/U1103]
MFNASHVDELFASTTRALQRSQVLLDERRSVMQSQQGLPPMFCVASSSAASTSIGSSAAAPCASTSSSFVDTVRSLQSLGEFRAYVEAAAEMMERVREEGKAPSPAMQQRRAKGQDFALLQSMTRGLRGAMTAAWQTSEATAALWASSTEARGGAEEAADAEDAASATAGNALCAAPGAHSGSTQSSGAQLASALIFSAFCVDLAIAVPRAASAIAAELASVFQPSIDNVRPPSLVSEWVRDGNVKLSALLRDVAALLPSGVKTRLVARLADVLFRPSPVLPCSPQESSGRPLGCELLSGGQLLLPSLDYYLLEQYPSSLASRWFLQPLQTTAEHLRADYYASADQFHGQCRWLLRLVLTLLYACQSAALPTSTSSRPPLERRWRTAQRLYDAWLIPLEKTFGSGTARHGMSISFNRALVQPHSHVVERLLFASSPASDGSGVSKVVQQSREWAGILYSAQYRLLLILEKLAHSEVAQANGTSSTSAKQRTYEAMLRQNGGKVSVSLLQTLAEDKQLVLDETPSRSPEGHRLYKLHDGLLDDSGKAVFVYLDDGALFTKVGRARAFQRVKSVEEIFKPLQ